MTKFKGHADEEMVRIGQVRELDTLGNNAADEAADFGRRRVSDAVIDARRNLSGVCGRWYPFVLELHCFFIAVSRVVVDHDDDVGTAQILSFGLLVLFPWASAGSCGSGPGFCAWATWHVGFGMG